MKEDHKLDASGWGCPQPLLKAKKILDDLASGQVLKVICTDPGSIDDFKVFCQWSVHLLLKSEQTDGFYIYWLQKGAR